MGRRYEPFRVPTGLLLAGFASLVVASGVGGAAWAQQPAPKQAAPKQATAKQPAAKSADDDSGEPQKVAATKRRDPAEAQRLIDAGSKQLQSGKADQAIQTLSAAISGGNLPPALMAKALHQRGAAYRKSNKPAQAISDLTSALWLKGGLNDADRADAVAQRSAAYREAGLPDQTDDSGRPAGAAAPRTASRAPVAEASAPPPSPGPTTALAPDGTAQAPAANPIGNLFAGLFGNNTRPTTPPSDTAPAPRAPRQEPATSGWSSTVVASPTAPAAGTARIATATAAPAATPAARPAPIAQPASAPAAAASGGRFHARIGVYRSQAEADAAGAKIAGQLSATLGGRSPQTSSLQFGGNTLFHVRIGPYASAADADALCAQVKANKVDCTPVDR